MGDILERVRWGEDPIDPPTTMIFLLRSFSEDLTILRVGRSEVWDLMGTERSSDQKIGVE